MDIGFQKHRNWHWPLGLSFWKRLLLYPSRLFSKEQKSFSKREALRYFQHGALPLSSHALQLSFTCKHRVAKFNFRYTFICFHIYIYIYIYTVLWKSLSPSLRIAWHIHPFWVELGLRIASIVTSLWGFHHVRTYVNHVRNIC